jgi:hypothetical protein
MDISQKSYGMIEGQHRSNACSTQVRFRPVVRKSAAMTGCHPKAVGATSTDPGTVESPQRRAGWGDGFSFTDF